MKPSIRIILILYAVAVAFACVYVPVNFEGLLVHRGYSGDSILDFKKNPEAEKNVSYGGDHPTTGLVSEGGYSFVWNPTIPCPGSRSDSPPLPGYINWQMVGIELIIITVIAGVAMLITGMKWPKALLEVLNSPIGGSPGDANENTQASQKTPEPSPTSPTMDARALALSIKELAPCLEPDVMHPMAIKAILLKFIKPRGLNLKEVYEMAVEARPKEWNEKNPAPQWEDLGISQES